MLGGFIRRPVVFGGRKRNERLGECEPPPFAGEHLRQRHREPSEHVRKRRPAVRRREVGVKHTGQSSLRTLVEVLAAFVEQHLDGEVDGRPERLHHVVREAKRVASAAMMKRERGMEPCGDDRASGRGAKNGVAVVQQRIGSGGISVASKASPEEGREVALRGQGFDIVGITRSHPREESANGARSPSDVLDHVRLRGDLGADDLGPNSLAGRTARLGLGLEPVSLAVVTVDREQKGDRSEVGTTDDEWCASRGQGGDGLRRQARGRMRQDDGFDVVERNFAQKTRRTRDPEEASLQTETPALTLHLDDTSQHGTPAFPWHE